MLQGSEQSPLPTDTGTQRQSCGAMEGLLPASGLTCQLILERLWGALLVIAESWGYLSGLLAVHWGTLAGCVQMFLSVPWDNLAGFVQILSTIRTAWNSQCTEAQGRSSFARREVPGNRGDTAEQTTQTNDTERPPAWEASPPTLHSLSLAVVTAHLRLSHPMTLGLLKGMEEPASYTSRKGRSPCPGHHRIQAEAERKGGGEGRSVGVEHTCRAGPERGSRLTAVRD